MRSISGGGLFPKRVPVVGEAAACASTVGQASEERLSNHMLDNGWFSEQALAGALEADGRWQFDQIPLRPQPQGLAELAAPTVAGALVQMARHWFAMRVQEGVACLIDSQKLAPECLGEVTAKGVQNKLASYQNVFLIRWQDNQAGTLEAPSEAAAASPSIDLEQAATAPSLDLATAAKSETAPATATAKLTEPPLQNTTT